MFSQLTKNLSNVFAKLRKKGFITEEDLEVAIREIKIALLEADVSLIIVKGFVQRIKVKAIGAEVIKSLTADEMIMKIVHEELTALLDKNQAAFEWRYKSPAVFLMVGLQGTGKTTSSVKFAYMLQNKYKKKVAVVSCDIYRPAAIKQLQILADQSRIQCLPSSVDESPIEIVKKAYANATQNGIDALIIDTAGRLHTDEEMMNELQEIQKVVKCQEIFLTLDAMIGQESLNIAKAFHSALKVSGVILTRLDGDARGGVALSIKEAIDCPVRFISNGEKINDFGQFDPKSIASRILEMGDLAGLIEKASEAFEEKEIESMVSKMKKGNLDLNDLLKQLQGINKIGNIGLMFGMIPGIKNLTKTISENSGLNDGSIKKQIAIILSMTKLERSKPSIIDNSRKKRIAEGSGGTIAEVNRLLKQFNEMGKMAGKIGKMNAKQLSDIAKRFTS